MTVFIALLRAVNVGGTGKLPMADLQRICEAEGFTQVRTYIASGNVVFASDAAEAVVKSRLQASLQRYAGKAIGVLVRSHAELAAVLARHPFPDAPGNRCVAIFLDAAPASDALQGVTGQGDEKLHLGQREIYVHYGQGMASSKLKIPAAKAGTARNMNTVAKLVDMAGALRKP